MINLLPPQYKNELSREGTKRLIIILGSIVFISFLSLILVLFSIKFSLNGLIESQETLLGLSKEERESAEIEELENKIKNFNQQLSRIDNFYEKQTKPTEILNRIFTTTPPEIYLTSLSYSKKPSQILLSGFSPSQEILFQFSKNLKKEFGKDNVKFPVQSWVQPTDINFTGVRISFGQ